MAALAANAPASLAKPLARFELLLNAAIGFAWGPLLFHFALHVAGKGNAWSLTFCIAATLVLGWAGSRVPSSYFTLRRWERAGRGRIYARYFGIRSFKRLMSHGDMMNAWLRRRAPRYRLVDASRESLRAYAAETRRIERAHLAWFVGALPIGVYGGAVGAIWFAVLWSAINVVTNLWPILLQRYNRVRVEGASEKMSALQAGGIAPRLP